MRFSFPQISRKGEIIEIQEPREKYYYNNATKEKCKFANSKLRKKSQNNKFTKIYTREN